MVTVDEFHEAFYKKHPFHSVIIKILSEGEQAQLPLTGHCMKPLLRENDLITVTPIPAEQLVCGNVAVYHINGRLKAHRFIKFITINKKKLLLTKSDRRYGYDSPVLFDNFLGIITQVAKGKKVVNYESRKWKRINFVLGKSSPYISLLERPLMFFIRIPRKYASKIFIRVMGINYRAYKKEYRKNKTGI